MLEHLASFAELVERLMKLASKRSKRDESVFKEVIDPTYVQLEPVVGEMSRMYSKVAEGITRLVNERRVGASEAATVAIVDTSTEQHGVLWAKVFKEEYRRIAMSQESEAREIVDSFLQARHSSRPFRVRIDAAAQSLHIAFSGREDEFGTRTRDFASKVRSLVGRAHNLPLANWHRSTTRSRRMPRGTHTSTSSEIAVLIQVSVPEMVRLREYSLPKLTSPHERYERRVERPVRIQVLSRPPESSFGLAEDGALMLWDALQDVGQRVSSDWEDIHYIYARLRLAALTKV